MIAWKEVARAEAPNIVLIVVDDLGYADMSCTGTTEDAQTPNIDKLAERGVRFTGAYATAPICNASRIALMTGRYQQRQGVLWYGGKGLHRPDFGTIAESLKQAGYATGFVGKFHHGSTDKVNGRGFPLNHGFDEFYGFSGGTKHYLHHARKYQVGHPLLNPGPMWDQRKRRDVEGLSTELFGERARKFMRAHRDEPFYLHVSFNAVHNFTHQLPETYLKEKGLVGFRDPRPNESLAQWRSKINYPAHPEGRDYYLGQLHLLDREIGRVVDELNELGLRENTAVFLISDNGGSLVTYAKNKPLRGGKYTLLEGGIRVPMIVRVPGATRPGTVTDQVASAMDLYPTICEIANVPIPDDLDGVSLLQSLSRPDANLATRSLYWDTGYEHAIRRGRWKLLTTRKSPNPALQIVKTPKGTFLYDIENDPSESVDLADKHPDVAAELFAAMRAWQQSVGDSAKSVLREEGP